MGCILAIASVELKHANWVVVAETTIVLFALYSAFYLLLFASTFYLNSQGPFILGSVLYLGFGAVMLVLFAMEWFNED
jgi:hypothetical protein